jgi:hypothetical protein
MSFRYTRLVLLVSVALLSACGSGPEAAVSSTQTPLAPTTSPTETPTAIPAAPTEPGPTPDPSIFGSIGINEIQAFALEPIANAIFSKTLNRYIEEGKIQEYFVISVTVFPGAGGLIAEILYNVRTGDPAWLSDGGTPTSDDWINNNCSRFDFFTTETEYQLKNRRLCN